MIYPNTPTNTEIDISENGECCELVPLSKNFNILSLSHSESTTPKYSESSTPIQNYSKSEIDHCYGEINDLKYQIMILNSKIREIHDQNLQLTDTIEKKDHKINQLNYQITDLDYKLYEESQKLKNCSIVTVITILFSGFLLFKK